MIWIWGEAYRQTQEKHHRWAGEKAKVWALATARTTHLDPELYALAAKVMANLNWEREQVRQPQMCCIEQRGRLGCGVVDEEG